MIAVLAWLVFATMWVLMQLEPLAALPGVRRVSQVCGGVLVASDVLVPASYTLGIEMFADSLTETVAAAVERLAAVAKIWHHRPRQCRSGRGRAPRWA